MKSPFEQLLRLAKRKREIVSVHNDPQDYDDVYCGLVDCVRDGELRLETYRRHGRPDGWCAMRLEDIFLVDVGGGFELRLAFLMAHKPSPPLGLRLPAIRKGPVILTTLRQAKEADLIVKVHLADGQYALGGFVHAVDAHELTINSFDTYGVRTGLEVVRMDHVRSIELGDADCLMAQHLHEHQAEFLKYKQEHRT
jgi:hypothetical protein